MTSTNTNTSTSSGAAPESDPKAPCLNPASVLRYPFGEMRLGWWEEYLSSVPSTERVTVRLRVTDCLMSHAVLHEDPFLEEAVMQMQKNFPRAGAMNLPPELITPFEYANHIFKTICVMAKFPKLEAPAKQELLRTVETRIQNLYDATRNINFNNKWKADLAASSKVVLESIARLRECGSANNHCEVFLNSMDAMKRLFFTISLRSGVVPNYDTDKEPVGTYVCYDGCPCYARLRTGFTVFLRDVEKAKVIDCIMIAAIKEEDVLMHDVVTELLSNHYKDFMENPYLDDIGRLIQNGKLFYCRTALFDVLNLITYLTQFHTENHQMPKDGCSSLDRIVVSFLWVKEEIYGIRELRDLVPDLDRALVTAESTYDRLGRVDCVQELRTLRNYAKGVFAHLSAPQFHLAVHSRDIFAGKPVEMKCASPSCPGTVKHLLKCSGCEVTYYCSSKCQRDDWETHKSFCHEIESRKSKPAPIAHELGPMIRIIPAI